ncbi:MAG: hypothetical protein LBV74_06240 [Tannerella sp.]|nr:hypothetical protein [Tannerella sp.]
MRFLKFPQLLAAGVISLSLAACSDDKDPTPKPTVENDFHIAFASGTESNSATLVQGVSDLNTGTISPRIGHEMESSRTARIFVSSDGSTIWSLNYTVGTIEKLTYQGADQYTRVGRIDASVPLGTSTVRFTKLNDEIGSVHYISATAQYEDNADPTTYLGHKMTASIGMLDLETMTMVEGYNDSVNVSISDELAKEGYYIFRIDCPVLSGGKLYYGAGLRKYNPLTNKNETVDKACALVIDYPSLANATVVMTDHVAGASNGYRTPTQHINEAGEILQMVSGNDEVHIVKLVNGQYTSFDFNLSEKINKPAASNGFFYAGNGIAYIPYEDLSKEQIQIGVDPQGEPSYSSMWKLARMDFNKGTAVDLNVPDDLWLTQYQNAVIRDGKIYIALSPVGVDGNIYIFDINSESANGTLGASITGTGSEQYYIGIY